MSNAIVRNLQTLITEETGAKTYKVEFRSGSKSPRHLRFGPTGEETLGYMRDGIFTTTGSSAGTYERLVEFGGEDQQHHVILMSTSAAIWCDGQQLTPQQ